MAVTPDAAEAGKRDVGVAIPTGEITGESGAARRVLDGTPSRSVEPSADDIRWLESRSMLRHADKLAEEISGKSVQWRNAYGRPRPRDFVNTASVWFTSYPRSVIASEDETVLQTLGSAHLLSSLREIGIEGIHMGPMKRAGGICGRTYTPSVDGFFDRIELTIDPLLGTDEQYTAMTSIAKEFGIAVIGDLIPAHTGKGPDFRLSERCYKDFAGLYTMVEIPEAEWGLLGEVPAGEDSVNLPVETVRLLEDKGHIPGQLEVTSFYEPGVKETDWSATDIVTGVDGRRRRLVYLHVFKAGQPSLDWLDPSFAAQRIILGDAVQSLHVWGDAGLRLDASPLLGIEPRRGLDKAWVEGHPLAEGSSNIIAMMIRKLGGYSFQEINASLEHLKRFTTWGPDLSYDFITRPPYFYAMATGNTEPLRLMMRLMQKEGLDPGIFVHALQNHDELMFDLCHLRKHGRGEFRMGDRTVTGKGLYQGMYEEAKEQLGDSGLACMPEFSNLGFCGTIASYAAASCGISDPYDMTDEEKDEVQKLHLLAAFFNAMQPGVFALSGWDLVGALPLSADEARPWIEDNDFRWMNRGAFDLVDVNAAARASEAGLPKAAAIYGSLPSQLRDRRSFASRLQAMLRARKESGIALSSLIAVGEPVSKGMFVMLLQRPDELGGWIITALNFATEPARENLHFSEIAGTTARLVYSTEPESSAGVRPGEHGRVSLRLGPRQGKVFVIEAKKAKATRR
jgi:trehalose synthase